MGGSVMAVYDVNGDGLADIVRNAEPTMLIGTSTQPAAFNEQIVKLISAGRYEAALPLARKSLELAQRIHDPSVATSMSNLANVYASLGRDADAESLLKSALVLEEATLGPLHVDVSITLTSLATIYLYRRRYVEAVEFILQTT
jgi:Flp pilus assembly protein TadD